MAFYKWLKYEEGRKKQRLVSFTSILCKRENEPGYLNYQDAKEKKPMSVLINRNIRSFVLKSP